MKKLKTVLLVIILACVGLFVYQNWQFFAATQYLRLDLSFLGMEELRTIDYPLAIFLLASFLLGALASFFSSLGQRFRSRKLIRDQSELIRIMKADLETLKKQEPVPVPRPEIVPDPEAANQV